MKTCIKCKNTKELQSFPKRKSSPDGHRNTCIDCRKVYDQQRYIKNRPKVLERAAQYYLENQEEKKLYQQEYYKDNSTALKEYQKRRRQENPELMKQRDAESYRKNIETRKLYLRQNKEKISLKRSDYSRLNRDKINAQCAKRRAQKLRATPAWANKRKIEHIYWVCNFLTEYTGIQHHVDHIHPLNGKDICGLHVHENLQILTAKENISKGNRWEQ